MPLCIIVSRLNNCSLLLSLVLYYCILLLLEFCQFLVDFVRDFLQAHYLIGYLSLLKFLSSWEIKRVVFECSTSSFYSIIQLNLLFGYSLAFSSLSLSSFNQPLFPLPIHTFISLISHYFSSSYLSFESHCHLPLSLRHSSILLWKTLPSA